MVGHVNYGWRKPSEDFPSEWSPVPALSGCPAAGEQLVSGWVASLPPHPLAFCLELVCEEGGGESGKDARKRILARRCNVELVAAAYRPGSHCELFPLWVILIPWESLAPSSLPEALSPLVASPWSLAPPQPGGPGMQLPLGAAPLGWARGCAQVSFLSEVPWLAPWKPQLPLLSPGPRGQAALPLSGRPVCCQSCWEVAGMSLRHWARRPLKHQGPIYSTRVISQPFSVREREPPRALPRWGSWWDLQSFHSGNLSKTSFPSPEAPCFCGEQASFRGALGLGSGLQPPFSGPPLHRPLVQHPL